MDPSVQQIQPKSQVQSNTDQDGAVDVRKSVGFLFDNRRLIAAVALVVTVLGVAYALLATPIYEATLLVQVQDGAGSPGHMLPGDLTNGANPEAPRVSAEIEILRSRLVASRAVDNTRLYISVQPKYFPLIGQVIAWRNKQISDPGLFGYGGYVWGAERAGIAMFNVPTGMEGLTFELTAAGNRNFVLAQDEEGIEIKGRVGELLKLRQGSGEIALRVESLEAKPGARFYVTRKPRLETTERLQDELRITEKGRQSGVISVSFQAADPELARVVLNEIGREYLRQNEDGNAQNAEKVLTFLSTQLPALKRDLEDSEARYNALRNRRGTVNLGQEASAVLEQSTSAQTKMVELKQRREELLTRFKEDHPFMQGLTRQMRSLDRELATVDAKIRRLPSVEQDVLRLTRDVRVNTDVYTAVLSTAHQLRLISASKVGNVRLLDNPVTPVRPVKPKRLLVIVAAGIVGLILGGLAALAKKTLYRRVHHPGEVEALLGLHISATIPHSERQRKLYAQIQGDSNEVAVLQQDAASDPALESLRGFRSLLKYKMLGSTNNVIMITGPTQGVGKSFVSANLAVLLASIGKKVLLIDGDLRTGYLHRYFGKKRENGLSDIVTGKINFAQAIHKDVVENVDFISTGNLPAKPAELLEHQNFSALLQPLSARYDFVFIDTPPVLAFSDALTVGAHAGAIFNIVRSGVSTVDEIEESVKCFNQAGHTVTGIVFNGAKSSLTRYAYGSEYGKYASAEPK